MSVGSISGGGRYDNLTGTFGMPGVSGVGISLGVDRIFDVMEELNLFSESLISASTTVMVTNFGEECLSKSLEILSMLRAANIKSEIYPENAKIKKQFEYADKKNIPLVVIVGTTEIENNLYNIKNMQSGQQEIVGLDQIISKINV